VHAEDTDSVAAQLNQGDKAEHNDSDIKSLEDTNKAIKITATTSIQ
jgi:hypothetical protein